MVEWIRGSLCHYDSEYDISHRQLKKGKTIFSVWEDLEILAALSTNLLVYDVKCRHSYCREGTSM